MKIKVLGTSFTLVSAIKCADLKKLEKYLPEDLILKDPETKEELFKVGTKSGNFTPYGVGFNAKNEEGFAQLTVPIPADIPAAKRSEFIASSCGETLIRLKQIEAQIALAVTALDLHLTSVAAKIDVLD